MSLYQFWQSQGSFFDLSAGSIKKGDYYNYPLGPQQEEYDCTKPLRKRRDDTNDIINQLFEATLVRRAGQREVVRLGGRKNKNEILGLTNARLVKDLHLNGEKYSRDMELTRGIQTNLHSGDFILVLRTDGRIVAMSDEVENHLGKTMRSLYTQCMNLYDCLDKADGDKLHSILQSSGDLARDEYQLVCTFRLPKGKRPSRTREDIKAISMAGHFYSCRDSGHDHLFVARCQALVSPTSSETSSSSMTPVNSSTMKITLNDDMTVSMVSTNIKDVLGYGRNEIIGNWFGRFLPSEDLEKLEKVRHIHFQNEQRAPKSVCELFDIYTNNGESRLTFLCQIRPTRERRSKSVKYAIVAQLIDSSMRSEYLKHVQVESEPNQVTVKVEQVNLVSPPMPKTSEDTIVADSPSISMGLLVFDNTNSNEFLQQQQQPSPVARSLSNVVAPFIFDDETAQLYQYQYDQYAGHINGHYWPSKPIDDNYIQYQLEQELASIDALINEF